MKFPNNIARAITLLNQIDKQAGIMASTELGEFLKLEQQLEEQNGLVVKLKTMLDEYIAIGDIRSRSIYNLIHEIREEFGFYEEQKGE